MVGLMLRFELGCVLGLEVGPSVVSTLGSKVGICRLCAGCTLGVKVGFCVG